jgi:hypothetical protein
VKDLIAEILSGDTEELDISTYSNIALDKNNCGVPNGKIVSFHSPIELHIYDESGNHTGPNEDGDIENNIDGAVYEVIEDNKFAFLPDGVEYIIKGNATDSGTFDIHIQEIVGGEVSTTTVFSDVPLNANTQTNFDLGSNIPSQIYLDHDGDDIFESNHVVSTTTAGFFQPVEEIPEEENSIEEIEEDVVASVSSSGGGSSISRSLELKDEELATEPVVEADGAEDTITLAVNEVSQPSSQEEILPENYNPEDFLPTETVVSEKSVIKNDNLIASAYQAVTGFLGKVFTTIWSWITSKL